MNIKGIAFCNRGAQRRVLFDGFSRQDGTVRAHHWLTAFFLKIFSKIVVFKNPEGKVVYLNKKSFNKWRKKHELSKEDWKLPPDEFVKKIIDFRKKQAAIAKEGASLKEKLEGDPAPDPSKAKLSDEDKKDLKFVVTTLATASLLTLWREQKTLEKIHSKLTRVSPLNSLSFIILDQELKALASKINRVFVWPEMAKQIGQSLTTYFKVMKESEVVAFADEVGLQGELSKLQELAKKKDGRGFLKHVWHKVS